jgi:hypothetical protein
MSAATFMFQSSLAVGEPMVLAERSEPASFNWSATISLVISLLVLGVVAYELRSLSIEEIRATVPASPPFWVTFAAYYCAGPVSEWVIYRRLWSIPTSGMIPLFRKLVSNEMLLGYLGEVQFYTWARSKTKMAAAPFGAIKDVTILSALVGNAATVALVALVWPMLRTTQIGLEMRATILSLSLVAASSILLLLFRRRLFSLPTPDLAIITLVHAVRTAASLGLLAMMWHFALPQVAFSTWLILATLRMLISRLPLIPNKDVLFAGLSVLLLGHDVEVAALLTMIAGALLVTHLLVGGVLGGLHLARWRDA